MLKYRKWLELSSKIFFTFSRIMVSRNRIILDKCRKIVVWVDPELLKSWIFTNFSSTTHSLIIFDFSNIFRVDDFRVQVDIWHQDHAFLPETAIRIGIKRFFLDPSFEPLICGKILATNFFCLDI